MVVSGLVLFSNYFIFVKVHGHFKYLANLVVFFLFVGAKGQGVVPNPSFDNVIFCPNLTAQWSLCQDWNNCGGSGTPDLYHVCGTPTSNPNYDIVPPTCAMAYCNPHSGGGMMGLCGYNAPFANYREYISAMFNCPLVAGNVYTVSFWVTVGSNPNYNFNINNLGVYISAVQPVQSGYNPIPISPQFEITSVINNAAWAQYTFTYSPPVTMNYISFGNYRTDAQTSVTQISSSFWPYAYWFLDDISVAGTGSITAPIPANINVVDAFCNTASGSATVSPLSGSLTYTWLPGNQTTSVVTGLFPGTYTVKISDGCLIDTKTLTVNTLDSLVLNISASSNSICSPSLISPTLTASGATSYTWQPGSVTTVSIVVTPTASTVYTVIGTNTLGCVGIKTKLITVGITPTVSVSASTPTYCFPGPGATLTANGASTYTWVPTYYTGSQITVNPNSTTIYTVTGTSTNCDDSKTVAITVNPYPNMTIFMSSPTVCAGQSVSITAGGASTYTWVAPVSNSNVIVISPTTSTTYSVFGEGSGGCISSTNTTVLVYSNPTITASPNSTAICDNQSYGQRFYGAANYTWMPGSITGSYSVLSPTLSTTYTITGTNMFGCVDTKTIGVTVNPSPTVGIAATATLICSGSTLTLSASGATSYVWFPGNIQATSIVVSPTTNLVYTAVGTNSFGCVSVNSLQINSAPVPAIVVAADQSAICLFKNVSITASGAQSYTWSPGGSNLNTITDTPLSTTIYTVSGLGANGCVGTKTIAIAVNPLPTITAVTSDTHVCAGSISTLSALGASSYTWLPLNTSGQNITVATPSIITTFTVIGNDGVCNNTQTLALIGIDCAAPLFGLTKAVNVPVLLYENVYKVDYTITAVNNALTNLTQVELIEDLLQTFPPPASFTIVTMPYVTSQGSGLVLHPGFDGINQKSITNNMNSVLYAGKRDTIVFELHVDPHGFSGPYKNWIVGLANYENLVFKNDSSNNGFIWDQNGNGSPLDDNAPTIVELPILDPFIPEVVTPNGDGKNDLFVIKHLNERKATVSIFNRWGNKVYEKENYDNSWNGYPNVNSASVGNGLLPQATYFFIIQFLDGNKETYRGYVVLQY